MRRYYMYTVRGNEAGENDKLAQSFYSMPVGVRQNARVSDPKGVRLLTEKP